MPCYVMRGDLPARAHTLELETQLGRGIKPFTPRDRPLGEAPLRTPRRRGSFASIAEAAVVQPQRLLHARPLDRIRKHLPPRVPLGQQQGVIRSAVTRNLAS